MENFDWESIKKELAESVKIEENKIELSIKIVLLKELNTEQNQMLGSITNMFKNEEDMKMSLSQFINEGKPIDCNITIIENERSILLEFEDESMYQKAYEVFHEIFFGDYFKKIIEAMMGAFGGMFGKDDFSPF